MYVSVLIISLFLLPRKCNLPYENLVQISLSQTQIWVVIFFYFSGSAHVQHMAIDGGHQSKHLWWVSLMRETPLVSPVSIWLVPVIERSKPRASHFKSNRTHAGTATGIQTLSCRKVCNWRRDCRSGCSLNGYVFVYKWLTSNGYQGSLRNATSAS